MMNRPQGPVIGLGLVADPEFRKQYYYEARFHQVRHADLKVCYCGAFVGNVTTASVWRFTADPLAFECGACAMRKRRELEVDEFSKPALVQRLAAAAGLKYAEEMLAAGDSRLTYVPGSVWDDVMGRGR